MLCSLSVFPSKSAIWKTNHVRSHRFKEGPDIIAKKNFFFLTQIATAVGGNTWHPQSKPVEGLLTIFCQNFTLLKIMLMNRDRKCTLANKYEEDGMLKLIATGCDVLKRFQLFIACSPDQEYRWKRSTQRNTTFSNWINFSDISEREHLQAYLWCSVKSLF